MISHGDWGGALGLACILVPSKITHAQGLLPVLQAPHVVCSPAIVFMLPVLPYVPTTSLPGPGAQILPPLADLLTLKLLTINLPANTDRPRYPLFLGWHGAGSEPVFASFVQYDMSTPQRLAGEDFTSGHLPFYNTYPLANDTDRMLKQLALGVLMCCLLMANAGRSPRSLKQSAGLLSSDPTGSADIGTSKAAPPCFKTCSEHESTDNHRHEHPVLASQLTRSFQFLQMYSAPTLQPTASASMPRAEPAFPSSESAMGPGVFKSDCQCPEVCLVG
eukprot:1144675-Pelagomonas_calceolata.AAC.2